MAERVGKEGHLVVDDHGAHQAEEGGDQHNGQKGVLHEAEFHELEGEKGIQQSVDPVHQASPPESSRPKISRTFG